MCAPPPRGFEGDTASAALQACNMSAPKCLLSAVAFFTFTLCGVMPAPAPQKSTVASEPIAIVSLNSDISPDGTFSYSYETANGITAQVRGSHADPESQSVEGSFSYEENGQKYSLSYKANAQDGYVPTADYLPTSPPIPELIQRSLEFNAKNPEPEDQLPSNV